MVYKTLTMKKQYINCLKGICGIFFVFGSMLASAQAFRKGSLLISITEGSTYANYTTKDISGNKPVLMKSKLMCGERDPLIFEYGLSNKWGVGFSFGADIFKVNSLGFYGFSTSDNYVTAITSELTVDVNYHVFVNKRLDLSVFASSGIFSIAYQGKDNDVDYAYNAGGNIMRFGTKARYYFWKRLGAVGMISSYMASATPEKSQNSDLKRYSTSINGMAIEMGLCFRILK